MGLLPGIRSGGRSPPFHSLGLRIGRTGAGDSSARTPPARFRRKDGRENSNTSDVRVSFRGTGWHLLSEFPFRYRRFWESSMT